MEKNHRKNNIRKVEYFEVIADNIKRLRSALDWTQEDLARKAKVARSTLAAAEQGKEISLSKLIKLAEALGLEPPDLFISEKDRREINYKHKLFIEKMAEYFHLEEEKNSISAFF